jgi:hypothetical protein
LEYIFAGTVLSRVAKEAIGLWILFSGSIGLLLQLRGETSRLLNWLIVKVLSVIFKWGSSIKVDLFLNFIKTPDDAKITLDNRFVDALRFHFSND